MCAIEASQFQFDKIISVLCNCSASGVELLDCIQHLLSWIPSAELLHERFVANLFELSNWREANSEVSVAALGAINELFYRQRTLPFPHIIVNGLKNVMKHSQSPATSELYQDKCTELLQLFMSQQCTRWIDDEQVFPEIITLLHAFTFASEYSDGWRGAEKKGGGES